MSKSIPVFILAIVFLVCGILAEAQQAKKVHRIGYVTGDDAARDSDRSEAIRLALHELGYIEGQNVAIEYRYAQGRRGRQSELVAELVRLKVDVMKALRSPR